MAGVTIDFLRNVTEGNISAVRDWKQISGKYNKNWKSYNGSKLIQGFNVSIMKNVQTDFGQIGHNNMTVYSRKISPCYSDATNAKPD